jgi:D-serine deaminase-like pyridoxal phosphate-dependent protein
MRAQVDRLGVALRPNVKTAKAIEVAEVCGHEGGVTVSTLAEAEYFAGHGITNILYGVAIAPGKLDRVARLRRQGVDLQVVTSSTAVAREVTRHGPHRAWIEIDCDGSRAGVRADDPTVVELAQTLGRGLAGVMTHAGGSYRCRSTDELVAHAERERRAVVEAASAIRAAGFDCPGVSVGSTPTLTFAGDLTGVTEARPGVYVFMDLHQHELGVCRLEDLALTVLATVVGHRSDAAIIDAGSLALSLDRSTDRGLGLVCDLDARPLGDHVVVRASQEHGIVARADGSVDLGMFPIGSKVRVMPNHACITAAGHDRYHVLRGGGLVAEWTRCNGW